MIVRKAYPQPPTRSRFAFIEVSDTTYYGKRGDRGFKIPLYVEAGVPSWMQYADVEALRLPHGVVYRIVLR